MSTFEKSIPLILKHEGRWVNNPNDSGGATNYGISLKFLADHPEDGDFDHDGDVDIDDIKQMSVDQAKVIYKKFWWDKFHYGAIADQTIATKVFDLSVNMGSKRAHIILQQTLNSCFALKLSVDGILGDATFSVINAVKDGNEEQTLLDAYCAQAWGFYQQLIAKTPKYSIFGKGWKNRAYDLDVANSVS